MCAQDSVSRSRRGVNTEAVAAGNESPKAVRSGWLSSTGRNGFGKVPGIPLAPRAGEAIVKAFQTLLFQGSQTLWHR